MNSIKRPSTRARISDRASLVPSLSQQNFSVISSKYNSKLNNAKYESTMQSEESSTNCDRILKHENAPPPPPRLSSSSNSKLPHSYLSIFGKEPLSNPLILSTCRYCKRNIIAITLHFHELECREMAQMKLIGWSDLENPFLEERPEFDILHSSELGESSGADEWGEHDGLSQADKSGCDEIDQYDHEQHTSVDIHEKKLTFNENICHTDHISNENRTTMARDTCYKDNTSSTSRAPVKGHNSRINDVQRTKQHLSKKRKRESEDDSGKDLLQLQRTFNRDMTLSNLYKLWNCSLEEYKSMDYGVSKEDLTHNINLLNHPWTKAVSNGWQVDANQLIFKNNTLSSHNESGHQVSFDPASSNNGEKTLFSPNHLRKPMTGDSKFEANYGNLTIDNCMIDCDTIESKEYQSQITDTKPSLGMSTNLNQHLSSLHKIVKEGTVNIASNLQNITTNNLQDAVSFSIESQSLVNNSTSMLQTNSTTQIENDFQTAQARSPIEKTIQPDISEKVSNITEKASNIDSTKDSSSNEGNIGTRTRSKGKRLAEGKIDRVAKKYEDNEKLDSQLQVKESTMQHKDAMKATIPSNGNTLNGSRNEEDLTGPRRKRTSLVSINEARQSQSNSPPITRSATKSSKTRTSPLKTRSSTRLSNSTTRATRSTSRQDKTNSEQSSSKKAGEIDKLKRTSASIRAKSTTKDRSIKMSLRSSKKKATYNLRSRSKS